MDFLDSLDLETTNKKTNRVRSWYLYEQFKSLERNQLQAAQKLKDRSYQDRILRQELSERRARRKIYDQFGLCHSESRLVSGDKYFRNKTELSATTDDYFESVCELQENNDLVEENILSEDTFGEDDSLGCKCYAEEFKSVGDTKDDSYDESVSSVVENSNSDENLSDDITNILKIDTNIAQNIHLQLEEAKENIQCIEKFTELADTKISEDDGVPSDSCTGELKSKKVGTDHKVAKEFESNLFTVWTRLVSFAYQLMQLNHGNCYYDYSSQFLTAVLACDVLFRGFSRMCNILQPYVSPIKYADESDTSVENFNLNKEKLVQSKMPRKCFRKKFYLSPKSEPTNTKKSHFNRKFRSGECWRRFSKDSFGNSTKKCERTSEPWRGLSRLYKKLSEKSWTSSSIWPEFSKAKDVSRGNRLRLCDCCWRREVENPMLRIAGYIDNMLKELEKCNNM